MNRRGGSFLEILSVLVMLATWVVPPVVFTVVGWTSGWWWVGWWVWLAVSLGVTELASKVITGRTISQHFWRWSAKVDQDGKYVNRTKAIITLVTWTVGWGIFIVHLAWKLMTGEKYEDQD